MANSCNLNISTVVVALLMAVLCCCLATTSVRAQIPVDPNATPSGTACEADSDCAADGSEFCRVGFCAAYVLEGDWCGGFIAPVSERRCATGYSCTDFPTDPLLADDGNGYCRKQCSADDDCSKGQVCGFDQVCRVSSKKSNDDKRSDSVIVDNNSDEVVVEAEAADASQQQRVDLRPLVSASTQEQQTVESTSVRAVVANKQAPLVSSSN